jgi:RNA polymerase sigma-70 factor, ECF subfamily
VTDDLEPESRVVETESLTMSFLLLLDRLSPIERAVVLLHDVIAYEFSEVAEIVGKTQANCWQLAVRARGRIRAERPQFARSNDEHVSTMAPDGLPNAFDEVAARFLIALRRGDLHDMLQLLAPDVVVYSDGGGKAPQWTLPITGLERLGRLLVGVGSQVDQLGLTIERHRINAQPGAIFCDVGGGIVFVFALDVQEGRVRFVRSIINPDKLHHLGTVADARAVAKQQKQRERRVTSNDAGLT